MDMAPRATVAVVDGLEEDSDVSLVLAGSPEFDNVRIPIYGIELMRRPWRSALVASVLVLGASLAGCASSSGGTAQTAEPAETDSGVITELDAAWLDGGRMIGLITQGSSTCIPTAEDVSYADGVLQVNLVDDAEGVCTADFAPRVSLVAVPDDVDASENLAIEVTGGYTGEVTLPGVEGLVFESTSDQTPSAGWTTTGARSSFSSGVRRAARKSITTAEITGDAAITVSLSGVPADKVCTADIAPNGQITVVDGLGGVADVALTLTGPAIEPFTTTILGVNGSSSARSEATTGHHGHVAAMKTSPPRVDWTTDASA